MASRESVPPESKSMSKQAIGVSQELGRFCRLHLENRLGEVPHRNLLAPVGVGPCGRYEDRRKGWYRQAKATKCGGTDGRKS